MKADQKLGDGGTKNGEVQRKGVAANFPHSRIPVNPESGKKPGLKNMPKAGAVRGGKYTRAPEGRQPYEPGYAVSRDAPNIKAAMTSQNTAIDQPANA